MRAQELRDTVSSFVRQPADRLKQHPCRRKDVIQQWFFAWPRQHVPRTHHLVAYAASITAPPSPSRSKKATSRWKRTDVGQIFTAQALPSVPISVPVLLPAREAEAEQEMLMPLPRDVENLADDPQLQNPLQRLERMSTGWFGVRFCTVTWRYLQTPYKLVFGENFLCTCSRCGSTLLCRTTLFGFQKESS